MIVFDNLIPCGVGATAPVGLAPKDELYRALGILGFDVAVLGQGLPSDYLIPYDAANSLAEMDLGGVDLGTFAYKGHLVWDLCRGSFRYAHPEAADPLGAGRALAEPFVLRTVALIDFAELLIERHRPEAFVVWGGMLMESRTLAAVAKRSGVPAVGIEFSFDPARIHFDPSGTIGNDFSWPREWREAGAPRLDAEETAWIEDWVAGNYVGRPGRQPQAELGEEMQAFLAEAPERPVLLLGQCFVDTVLTYDNPHFADPLKACEAVIEACVAAGAPLVVKSHPGDRGEYKEALRALCEGRPHVRFCGLETNENVYALMDACACGVTINSQAGLEMLAKGRNVLTLGRAFYAFGDFGLSLESADALPDALARLRREPALAPEALARCRSFLHGLLTRALVDVSVSPDATARQIAPRLPTPPRAPGAAQDESLRVLICHASSNWAGSGFYLQDLGMELIALGHQVAILSEGTCVPEDRGVRYRRMGFDGQVLDRESRAFIDAFAPNVVLEAGVRTKPIRAALEVALVHRPLVVVQAEDDELIPHRQHHPKPDGASLLQLDHASVFPEDLGRFLAGSDMAHLALVLSDPQAYRWVEPVFRSAMYLSADRFAAIWTPMARRMRSAFNKPCDLLPPVIRPESYDATPLSAEERSVLLGSHGLSPDTLVYFVNGTVYDFSDEFERFLEAMKIAASRADRPLAVLVCGTSRLKGEAAQGDGFAFRALGRISEGDYNRFMRLADVVCAPGVNDSFNRYRMSSRLVKGLVFGKPIFTFKTGFAEDLEDDVQGFFTHTDDVGEWADVLTRTLDPEARARVGEAGRALVRHFDAANVAGNLAQAWSQALREKREGPDPSADGLVTEGGCLQALARIYHRRVPLPQRQRCGIALRRSNLSIYEMRPGALFTYGFGLKARGRHQPGKGSHVVRSPLVGFALTRRRKPGPIRLVLRKDKRTNAEAEFHVYDMDGPLDLRLEETDDHLHVIFESTRSTFMMFKPKSRRRINSETGEPYRTFYRIVDIVFTPDEDFAEEAKRANWMIPDEAAEASVPATEDAEQVEPQGATGPHTPAAIRSGGIMAAVGRAFRRGAR